MRPVRRVWLHVLVVALLAASSARAGELAAARPKDVGLDADKIQQAHAAVQALVAKREVAGAVVAVARRGKVAMFEAFGESEAGSGRRMTPDAIVRIYSMTKPITTVAAMILVEEGKIGLDDPVSRHLPEFKDQRVHLSKGDETTPVKGGMTVRDLMRHTAGLTYGVFGNSPVDQLYRKAGVLSPADTNQDLVAKLGKLPLLYEPGTRWHYSAATDVLGRVVEVASGKPLDEFFAERIFRPLDMRDTGFSVPADRLDRFSANHGTDPKAVKLVATEKAATSRYRDRPRFVSGGGGGVSTARDYLRFCQMLLNGGDLDGVRILKKESVAEMTRNQLPEPAMKAKNGGRADVGDGFGLGFAVRVGTDDPAAGKAVGEYSWGGAASTHFWISPKQELAVVALEQYMPNRPKLAQAIKPLIYQAARD